MVFLSAACGALERGARGLQVGFGAAQGRLELLSVELDQHIVGLDHAVDVHVEGLDDAVGFGFDLDLGDGLDLPGRDDRPDHRAPFGGRQLRRIDAG